MRPSMAKPRAYIETSVVSYLTAQPSRDLVLAAHQEVTREWWSGRDRFDLLVSEAVLEEISRGDAGAAARRIAAIEGIAVLSVTEPLPGHLELHPYRQRRGPREDRVGVSRCRISTASDLHAA